MKDMASIIAPAALMPKRSRSHEYRAKHGRHGLLGSARTRRIRAASYHISLKSRLAGRQPQLELTGWSPIFQAGHLMEALRIDAQFPQRKRDLDGVLAL